MAQRYVSTAWIYPNLRRHVTYVSTQPDVPTAPGQPSDVPGAATTATPINLDELIRKKLEKARRMRQR